MLVRQVDAEDDGVAQGYALHVLNSGPKVNQLRDPQLLQPGGPAVVSHPDTKAQQTLRGIERAYPLRKGESSGSSSKAQNVRPG